MTTIRNAIRKLRKGQSEAKPLRKHTANRHVTVLQSADGLERTFHATKGHRQQRIAAPNSLDRLLDFHRIVLIDRKPPAQPQEPAPLVNPDDKLVSVTTYDPRDVA